MRRQDIGLSLESPAALTGMSANQIANVETRGIEGRSLNRRLNCSKRSDWDWQSPPPIRGRSLAEGAEREPARRGRTHRKPELCMRDTARSYSRCVSNWPRAC